MAPCGLGRYGGQERCNGADNDSKSRDGQRNHHARPTLLNQVVGLTGDHQGGTGRLSQRTEKIGTHVTAKICSHGYRRRHLRMMRKILAVAFGSPAGFRPRSTTKGSLTMAIYPALCRIRRWHTPTLSPTLSAVVAPLPYRDLKLLMPVCSIGSC